MSTLDPVYEATNRKLTLIDLAPAFIFLLTGYFISFGLLIVEIVSSRKKIIFMKKYQKGRGRNNVSGETHV